MRMRRMELAVIGITLAFAIFMGGFFTGRSWSVVNISSAATENTVKPVEPNVQVDTGNINTTTPGNDANTYTPQYNTHADDSAGSQQVHDGRININTASESQLRQLPGIGPALAERIVDYRSKNGAFSRIEDIRNVSGIGERRFEAIQDLITVGN